MDHDELKVIPALALNAIHFEPVRLAVRILNTLFLSFFQTVFKN